MLFFPDLSTNQRANAHYIKKLKVLEKRFVVAVASFGTDTQCNFAGEIFCQRCHT